MNQVNLLRQTLKPLLGWHGARLSFLALFIIALLRVKTINLVELATGFRSHAKSESSYKRLQRFFRHFDVEHFGDRQNRSRFDRYSTTLDSKYRVASPTLRERTEWS